MQRPQCALVISLLAVAGEIPWCENCIQGDGSNCQRCQLHAEQENGLKMQNVLQSQADSFEWFVELDGDFAAF